MTNSNQKFQLRGMYLVNAGTNTGQNSGRLTMLDPRGGAAVMGANGVGKTTTLRMLTIFMALTPTQLLGASGGRQSMVQFLLPSATSAIVFEYQRGSDKDEDIRMVVVRRQEKDPSVPFYRFYKGGFRPELFTENGKFLEDTSTNQKAAGLGIQMTPKLTTAEYRSVILRTKPKTKDKQPLYALAMDYSFGPKPLDNLDLIAATMLKERIDFEDIIRIAVDLVQADMGMGADNAKLSVGLSKQQVNELTRNRTAVTNAIRMAPKIEALGAHIRGYQEAGTKMASLSAAVFILQDQRKKEQSDVRDQLSEAVAKLSEHQATQAVEVGKLTTALNDAREVARVAAQEHLTEKERQDYYEREKAGEWELKVTTLSTREAEVESLNQQVEAMEAHSSEVVQQYRDLEQAERTSAQHLQLELERAKQPHRDRLAAALDQIAQTTSQEEARITEESDARRDSVQQAIEECITHVAHWREQKNDPRESPAAAAQLTAAYEKAQHQNISLQGVEAEHAQQAKAAGQCRRDFEAQEDAVRKARRSVEQSKAAVEQATRNLTPAAGSLLEALRNSEDTDWKKGLAKVISPELLERTDLAPRQVDSAVDSLYGWNVNTSVLDIPDWCDDERAKSALEEAQASLVAAQSNLEVQDKSLTAMAQAKKVADEALEAVSARLTVAKQHSDAAHLAVEQAKALVRSEKTTAARQSDAKLAEAEKTLAAARESLKAENELLASTRKTVKNRADGQRTQAQAQEREAISDLDRQIAGVSSKLEKTLADLAAQLKKRLEDDKVDVEKLAGLRQRAKDAAADVKLIKSKDMLVAGWKKWHAEVGAVGVTHLQDKLKAAESKAGQCLGALQMFNASSEAQTQKLDSAAADLRKRLAQVAEDLTAITSIESHLVTSSVAPAALANTIRGEDVKVQVLTAARTCDESKKTVERSFNIARGELTITESKVREFVEHSLAEVPVDDVIVRAAKLCECYGEIAPRLTEDINLSLKTQLGHITVLHKTIERFSTEVGRFNRKLQSGFGSLQRFERIEGLKLDIVTNFENLGFFSKLSNIKQVIREYQASGGFEDNTTLPPAEVVNTLGDFMSTLATDGTVDIDLATHISLKGEIVDNGKVKAFKRSSELQNISSTGLSSLVLLSMLTALLNTIRGDAPVVVPLVTDEVGKFDATNFASMFKMLSDNHIDVVTASPELGPMQQMLFAHRYQFGDRGRIRQYEPRAAATPVAAAPAPAAEPVPAEAIDTAAGV